MVHSLIRLLHCLCFVAAPQARAEGRTLGVEVHVAERVEHSSTISSLVLFYFDQRRAILVFCEPKKTTYHSAHTCIHANHTITQHHFALHSISFHDLSFPFFFFCPFLSFPSFLLPFSLLFPSFLLPFSFLSPSLPFPSLPFLSFPFLSFPCSAWHCIALHCIALRVQPSM